MLQDIITKFAWDIQYLKSLAANLGLKGRWEYYPLRDRDYIDFVSYETGLRVVHKRLSLTPGVEPAITIG